MKRLFLLLFLPALMWAQVYVLEVHGTIDMGLAHFFERAIPEMNTRGGDAILLDIDTFGGRVDAATMMKNALLRSDVMTIAYINTKAISAGSLISLACDTIIMHSGATFGATTVVDQQANKANEKAQSYMREEMAATAEAKGRNGQIAMAMVDESLDVDTLVTERGDTLFLTDVEGARAGKLLTLRTKTALKYGMADYQMESQAEILNHFGFKAGMLEIVKPTWSEKIVRFLTDPVVSSLLMTIGFLGLIFELQSPGWGIGGTIAVVALALFFSTSIIADLASMTDLIIILIGFILLGLEVFVVPGFGVTGIAGIIVLMFGLFRSMIPEIPTQGEINRALIGILIAMSGAIAGVVLLVRNIGRTKFWQKISLQTSELSTGGYSSSLGLENLAGATGTAITSLRPAGTAIIGDQRLDVVTLGNYIEKDTSIEVVRVDGNRIVVRELKSEKPNQTT
ncbi:MAG: nodulation protein NfeD [Lentisphaeria bacterium]|nr:nodulation protein NfeD [Candidatus Neomarinimicrobiota bacterium]MCF7841255.1 nodulation protein NfeD [Lentisphaeria bacterium]